MKTAIVGTAVFGLALATGIAYAQHDRGDDHRGSAQYHPDKGDRDHGRPAPQGHRDRRDDYRPEARHDVRPPQQAYRQDSHQPHYRPADEHVRDYHYEPPHPRGGDVWARERAHHWEREHHSWRERGGYVGYRIPDRDFHEHFGRGHFFRVYGAPMVVVDGRPRFHYGGFWFAIIDPWPETWAANWYQTDDVYVDYLNDGYYLCNRSHPGVHIAINVSL
ncbi:MAG TPA: hypothetical protein VKW78_11080 [Terriglobales bacterium]|nr:hypothetical protein [Terriglobales bacterium]